MRQTIDDWLVHARLAADPALIETCLLAAAGLARSGDDWLRVLRGAVAVPLATRQGVSEVADQTLAMATAEREVWGFREVARVRATRLGDEAGARAALESGEAA